MNEICAAKLPFFWMSAKTFDGRLGGEISFNQRRGGFSKGPEGSSALDKRLLAYLSASGTPSTIDGAACLPETS